VRLILGFLTPTSLASVHPSIFLHSLTTELNGVRRSLVKTRMTGTEKDHQ